MSYESYLKKLLTEYYSNTGEEFNYEYHLDMTTAGLTKVLKGQVKNPSLSTIQKLAEYKNQDPTEIVRDMFFHFQNPATITKKILCGLPAMLHSTIFANCI